MSLEPLLRKSVALARSGKRANGSVAVTRKGAIALDREGNPVLPKALAECADLLYKTRQTRLDAQRELEQYEKLEAALREKIINELPKSKASGISGKVANARLEQKHIPQVNDWDKFYAYVKKTGKFILLQRRLAEAPVREMMEDKVHIPGVGVFHATVVSCTAIKEGR